MRSSAFPAIPAAVLLLVALVTPVSASPDHFSITAPDFVLSGVPFELTVFARDSIGGVDSTYFGQPSIIGVTFDGSARFSEGVLHLKDVVVETGMNWIRVADGLADGSHSVRAIPGILSILPPLIAILFALIFRNVVLSLFAGIWIGAVFIYDYDLFGGLLRVVDHFVVGALANPDRAAIIVFTMLFGGMVGVISRNGGMTGIANKLTAMAATPRRGQLATWVLGVVIFFDDYANTLIVGNTMRPITDKLRISREKLAYIVDATAAPVASVFFISSWIGYEVGLIDAAITSIGYVEENAYWIFIDTIVYRFYPILTLVLGFTIAISGRDFGAMHRAEQRARKTGKLFADGARLATDPPSIGEIQQQRQRWWNGAIPILTVLVVGIAGLYQTGYASIVAEGGTDFSISNIIGSSDSYRALQWAAFSSCIVAIGLTVSQKIMNVRDVLDAWFNGVSSVLFAVLILLLAWSIGEVTTELKTADFLVGILRGNLSPHLLPVLTFIVAGLISFSTGTSWGTMGILMPLVIPLSVALSVEAGLDATEVHILLLGGVSSILAGAVAGDHCSPISDTTILSSTASSCDHIDHVRTQLPYAVVAALVGMVVGDIPTAYGLHPAISIAVGSAVVIGIVFVFGKKS